MKPVIAPALLASLLAGAFAEARPQARTDWSSEQTRQLLDATRTIRLAPDLSGLSEGESQALTSLLDAGQILHELYLDSRHPQALSALRRLRRREALGGTEATRDLLTEFRLFEGPIATTLDNRRLPFLAVDAEADGKNVYPQGADAAAIDAFLARHPEARDTLLAERSVVRRASRASLDRDLGVLRRHSLLDTLHPGLRARLEGLANSPGPDDFYAVPYSVAWAEPLLEVHRCLTRAASALAGSDPEFAGYLRNRARDLLSDDYESGDAAWVTGRFGHLNAQIGAYETYDDALFGVKAFWSMSLLLRDDAATADLRKGLADIQAVEDALPYAHHRRVRQDIPVGVYDVIADFGQARGTNTATILPNDALYSRRYGRTILMRANIIRNPQLFASRERGWRAVVAEAFDDDLSPEGDLQRTLWHEVGHYLGVDRDREARSLDVALGRWADALEEMKADLVSLFAAQEMVAHGAHDAAWLRAVEAGGIRRTLQSVRPRPDQPYQTMELAQFNDFLAQGLIDFDAARGELTIHYDRYREVVRTLLGEVLEVQYSGDPERAARFFARRTGWEDAVHGVIAEKIRAAQGPRFTLVRYAALPQDAQPGYVLPSDPRVSVMGRVQRATPFRLRVGYPGVTFRLRFAGRGVRMLASSTTPSSYLDVRVDGGDTRVLRVGTAPAELPLAEGLEPGEHRVEVVKRTETWQGILDVRGFRLDEGARLLSPEPLPERRLMVIGDSVTCGTGIDRAPDCSSDMSSSSNGDASYGMLLGRALHAQVQLVCYGGRGLVRDWRGMRNVLEAPQFASLAVPEEPSAPTWEAARYRPDVILVSLGTNDFNLALGPLPERERFVSTYVRFVRRLLRRQPAAHVLLTEGAIINDESAPGRRPKSTLREYIAETVRRVNDPRVAAVPSRHYPGDRCDAHPTRPQHEAMARDLEPAIRKAAGW